jgi:glycosyltransferase involved in cell wall biosynthesis
VTRSVVFFCGQPLVGRPISQRIGAFGAYLASRGWGVTLTDVDPSFGGTPFSRHDPGSGMEVEAIGPTHYRVGGDGTRTTVSPVSYLRECHRIARRLEAHVARAGAEQVVVSTTLPASLYAVIALRLAHRSVWLDIDDWSAAQFSAGGGGRVVAAAYDVCERAAPRAARGITVCSKELAGLFRSATIVPNFIRLADVPEPVPPGSGATADADAPQKIRVGFASSVTAYHGHVAFLEALARRRTECAHLDVVVIGGGELLVRCREIVAAARLDGVVRFTGALDRASMLDELTRCDVSVLPLQDTRLDRARFPLKLLDSLACGCALAASDVGTAHETLADGVSALLSPPGDMDALVGNVLVLAARPELRAALAHEGRRVVREFDEPVVCERWMRLLSEARAP